jgi:hypothetical protein
MSNFYVDGQITGPTFQQGFNLSSILVSIGNRQDAKVVKVQITEPGVYYLNSALKLYCNIIIEGCEGAVIAVKFSSDTDYNNGNAFMHFNYITKTIAGRTSYIRPNIVIKNVEFLIDGDHHWHTTTNVLHFLKFYWADSIRLDNVKIKLEEQHIITNIDMRECENVIVENCLLENYHNNTEPVHEGGILWFRGMTRNVKISNNIIKKSGNDEALGFFGHYLDSTIIPSIYVPADGICHKENIIVENNVFVYEKHYSNSNSNGCLISIIDHDNINDPVHTQQGNTLFHIENIVFENNKLIINDLCLRFINCRFEDQTFLRDVFFKNNNFEIGDFSVVGNTISVFELINSYPSIDTKYEIIGNTLYNKASVRIYDNYPGLYFLTQIGGEVKVSENITRVCDTLSDQIYRQIYFFWNHGLNNNLIISDNDLEGIYLFGEITSGDYAISSEDLIIKNNIIKGSPRIYCMDVGELNAFIEDNTIITSDYLIAFQNFGTSGRVIYINNHFKSIDTNVNPVFYESWENISLQALFKMDVLCFANNVLEGTSTHPLNYLQQHMTNCVITDEDNRFV